MKIPWIYYGDNAVDLIAGMLAAMPVGPDGMGFGESKSTATIVDHRHPDWWLVSFRPVGDDPTRTRYYRSVRDAAQAVLDGKHNPYGQQERPY